MQAPPADPRQPIQKVQLDGLVVMKVVKHCQDNYPLTVTGALLGMDVENTLQITNCYPLPQRPSSALSTGEQDRNADNIDQSQYQMNMMRCVREVNIDHQVVGWYQSSGSQMGSFLTVSWIEVQFSYQDNLENVVCLVYDPVRTDNGTLGVRAYRLTQSFMELRKRREFTSLGFSKWNVTSAQIIEEVPIEFTASSIQKAFMAELFCSGEMQGANEVEFSRLGIFEGATVEQTMEFMINDLEELNREQNKYSYVVRNNMPRLAAVQQEIARKRRAGRENEDRRAEEEQLASVLKDETSRLESKMLLRELHSYIGSLTTTSTGDIIKENAVYALQLEE